MKFMITKKTEVNGVYEELISDCAPSWGTYSRNVTVIWEPGKLFSADEIKDGYANVKTHDLFGASMISGETYYNNIPVQEFIDKGIAVPLTDEDYITCLDLKNQASKLNKSIYKEQEIIDYAEINIDEIKENIDAETHMTQKRYEELSARMLSSTLDIIKHSSVLSHLMSEMDEVKRKWNTFFQMAIL